MPASKAKIKANNKYTAGHYDSIRLWVHKGNKEIIKAYAEAQGKSVNALINALLEKEISQLRH